MNMRGKKTYRMSCGVRSAGVYLLSHAYSPWKLSPATLHKLTDSMSRRPLATSQYVVSHAPTAVGDDQTAVLSPSSPSSACAHYFLDPLSWMRPELEQGKLDGRLECPKCHTNVGKYAWQGMQCSCGDWVVPGISLARGRVDEVKSRTTASGIRRPPGAVAQTSGRGPGMQNL